MGKMTVDKIPQIIELYKRYGTGEKVAKELDITLYMVYKHLRANGIEPKKNGQWQQKVDLQTVIHLYESGMSTTQIAKRFNMSATSVWERLHNAGIQLRDNIEGMVAVGYKKRGPDEEILKMYQDGMNAAQIARSYGLKDQKTILEVLHKHNIKIEIHAERSPHWKGGKLKLNKMVRNCAHYINWRSEIFAECDYTCAITGQRGGKLNVHHIKPLADLLDEFILASPNDFVSQDDHLRAIEEFEPFWDKTNIIVVTEETHHQIHSNDISVLDIQEVHHGARR
jgi:DNA invertase Pin-like site-specific DNA recombinase